MNTRDSKGRTLATVKDARLCSWRLTPRPLRVNRMMQPWKHCLPRARRSSHRSNGACPFTRSGLVRRNHPSRPCAQHRRHPGFDGVPLDPGERLPDRPVMRCDDAFVAADHRHQRDRFRRRQGDVAAGTMDNPAVPAALAEMRAVRHPAFEDSPERIGIDRAGEPERRRALARPGARFAVRCVVLRVVAVLFEIARAPCDGEAMTPIKATMPPALRRLADPVTNART